VSHKSSGRKATPMPVYPIPFNGPATSLPSKEEVGSKAYNLMVIAQHGLPVPPGFVLGTQVCRNYFEHGRHALDGLEAILATELERVGAAMGRRFGDAKRPLLVSVRSGAAVSMPGMMETVLNVGLSQDAVQGMIRLTGNPRLALDCRRRLVEQFAQVVNGAALEPFEAIVAERLRHDELSHPHQLDTEALREVCVATLVQYETATGKRFSEDPMQQLTSTIEAVLQSWSSERAKSYRCLNGIADDAGTAVTVQAMVFGNAGPSSGSGVGFTRNPADGSNLLYVDYLPNAQGEDVVAGRRNALGAADLERRLPAAYAGLLERRVVLEQAFGDMQDFEFTVEDGHLYILQCRSGKRTPLAALRIAHDLVAEGLITPQAALAQLAHVDTDGIETTQLTPGAGVSPLAHGVPASAGVIVGAVVLDPARIETIKAHSKAVILVREHAETGDISALSQSGGLITRFGARTSHAAVVARQLGKVCLVGCEALAIDASLRSCRFGDTVINEGDIISVDGGQGTIYAGAVSIEHTKPKELLAEVRRWRKLKSAGVSASR